MVEGEQMSMDCGHLFGCSSRWLFGDLAVGERERLSIGMKVHAVRQLLTVTLRYSSG